MTIVAVRGVLPYAARAAWIRGQRPSNANVVKNDGFDYVRRLPTALRSKEIDDILRCLGQGALDAHFIRSIAPSTFTAVLGLLRPGRMLADWEQALAHNWWIRGRHYGTLPSRWHVYARFSDLVASLVDIRRRAGMPLGMLDYRHLMHAATGVANSDLARSLLLAMRQDGLQPDADCITAYLHCLVWDRRPRDPDLGDASGAFRTAPINTSLRRKGKHPFAPAPGVYVVEAEEAFQSLLSRGLVVDEAFMCHMMTAYARENDMDSCVKILFRFWNVDAENFETQARPYPPGHPLRPTGRLLHTIAHAFGATNRVTTSLRIIDQVSTAYDIHIGIDVWEEIFVWTFSHSWPRGSSSFGLAHKTERLTLKAVEQLWQVMTNEPYRVRPTLRMYHLSIKNLTQFQRYDIVVGRIREGLAAIHADNATLSANLEAHRSAWLARGLGAVPKTSKWALKRRRIRDVGVAQRNAVMLKRWCRWYYEQGNRGPGFRRKPHEVLPDGTVQKEPPDNMRFTQPFWAYRDVPNFLAEFANVGPHIVTYRTHTGFVSIRLRWHWPTEEEHMRNHRLLRKRQATLMKQHRQKMKQWLLEHKQELAEHELAMKEGAAPAKRHRDGIFTSYDDDEDDYGEDEAGDKDWWRRR
ncbi:uncharacterized protein K452DRAFT_301664 [Aplosporella prunicola CBS 121167]|uniref:ATPase expression protein 2, mitochondrial n=1 Tax=Aplosporella prunicola CBS 121167 TaxID=1176127 RepID=A0A6A6B1M6_9PEZI|nr:uncharacterized protein K452DRAFT_301664 [Aplosporella prunicola CBS 121167]KAF2137950.1 hypothetical protein K452DRAFT_301664 [Aplosporella prunicola CBS 121167]